LPTLTIPSTFTANTTAQSSQVNANFSAISTFLNSTKIDSDNIQAGGISEANLATSAVATAKIADSAVTTAKINDSAVTTAKINDSAVTTAKIADTNVTTGKLADSAVTTAKITDANVTTAKLADSAVTTDKINANAVTRAKLASVGQQLSSSSSTFSGGQQSYTDVTGLSVSITTTGRPVIVAIISDASGNPAQFVSEETSSGAGARGIGSSVRFMRDATEVGSYGLDYIAYAAAGSQTDRISAPANYLVLDAPGAGTYTYKVQYKGKTAFANTTNPSTYFRYAKLVAYEL
jgi:hypothetical protein